MNQKQKHKKKKRTWRYSSIRKKKRRKKKGRPRVGADTTSAREKLDSAGHALLLESRFQGLFFCVCDGVRTRRYTEEPHGTSSKRLLLYGFLRPFGGHLHNNKTKEKKVSDHSTAFTTVVVFFFFACFLSLPVVFSSLLVMVVVIGAHIHTRQLPSFCFLTSLSPIPKVCPTLRF